ncbi:hypothetical protein L9F63_026335, partial [Diploptera punctata]
MTEEVLKRFLSPWLYPDFIYNLSPGGRRFKKYVKILHDFSNKVIRDKRQHYRKNKIVQEKRRFIYRLPAYSWRFLSLSLSEGR